MFMNFANLKIFFSHAKHFIYFLFHSVHKKAAKRKFWTDNTKKRRKRVTRMLHENK